MWWIKNLQINIKVTFMCCLAWPGRKSHLNCWPVWDVAFDTSEAECAINTNRTTRYHIDLHTTKFWVSSGNHATGQCGKYWRISADEWQVKQVSWNRRKQTICNTRSDENQSKQELIARAISRKLKGRVFEPDYKEKEVGNRDVR